MSAECAFFLLFVTYLLGNCVIVKLALVSEALGMPMQALKRQSSKMKDWQ
jgi:hypothetical protein